MTQPTDPLNLFYFELAPLEFRHIRSPPKKDFFKIKLSLLLGLKQIYFIKKLIIT